MDRWWSEARKRQPAGRPEVPAEVVAALGAFCLGMPEANQESAWVGTRWRVRGHTFGHVLRVADGWPPVYARAAGSDGPVTVLTFESAGLELAALRRAEHPFFAPPWRHTIVGLHLLDGVDWDEVRELLTESYRVVAPRRLAQALDRSDD